MSQLDKINPRKSSLFKIPSIKVLSPSEIEQDMILEQELIQMMSNLEFTRANLSDMEAQINPAQAVESLISLVNQVVAFTESHLVDEGNFDLPVAMAKAGDFYTSARELLGYFNRSSWKMLFGLLGKKPLSKTEAKQLLEDTKASLLEVLESYFVLYSPLFQSTAAGSEWSQTYGIFLADLAQVLDKL